MIKKASELDFSNKNYVMLILGRPGIGKTTLAESAPNPILIDLENGVDRVEACYRTDVSVVDDSVKEGDRYQAFVNDIKSEEMKPYDTIIIDSLGKLIDLMTPVVIKENPINGQKDGKTLSLKGFGAIKTKEKEFFDLVKSLRKNLIIIAHVSEFQDGDVTKTRVNVSGSIKDSIWDDVDLGGFVEFQGKERVIHFSPSEKWDAKGTHGITGTYSIPSLLPSSKGGKRSDNTFLTDLFKSMTENLVNEQKLAEDGEKLYNEAMKIAPEIEAAKTADDLNALVAKLKETKHGLTSQKELQSKFKKKVAEIGAAYDKESGKYIVEA